ncbi:MAG: UMP kinase [Clostridiales bacterium]|nr:UMP kinase [Clostridiales bacterium]
MNSKHKNRIILKLSGEAIAKEHGMGINFTTLDEIAIEIKNAYDLGYEIAIVIGGGNFWRGRSSQDMDRSTADYMGMLATVINSLALQSTIENIGIPTRVMSAIEMNKVAEPYIRRKAVRHLEKKRVVIFSAGTGNPFFSTDTTAALRAAEIDASKILFAKNIDAVYDKDPKVFKDAKKFDKLTYKEVIDKELQVIDLTAATLLNDNDIPIHIFGLDEPHNIIRILNGEKIGTEIRRNF